MCPTVWAHWLHLANMTELVLPLAHASLQPNGKSISSAVSAQLTAESPHKPTLQRVTLTSKIAPCHGGPEPNRFLDSLGHSEITIQTA